MNVAIVGCGLIGNKRAQCLKSHRLVIAVDVDDLKAKALAEKYDARWSQSWQEAVRLDEVDAVLVSTTHDKLAEITLAAVEAGKHVLVDKPAARHHNELEHVIEAARLKKRKIRVGFNHRFHPAIEKAHALVASGAVGPLMFIRGRYGHGGRIGYEKEWRADREIGGGGELLDQGMHLIDLCRWLLGEFPHVDGFVNTYFWDMNVEDNAFMMLRTEQDQMAWLHVSWTEWKNMFSLEIYGRDGKLQIDGLGGSYGVEKLTYYKMLPEMGPPKTEVFAFDQEDQSWQKEFDAFVEDIELEREPSPNAEDAYEALKIVHRIYERNLTGAGRSRT